MPDNYLKQCWLIVNLTTDNKFQQNFNEYNFSFKDVFQNVVFKMVAILRAWI